ncbi:MAG: metal-dependent hydrolase [Kosmotogaceae bacterium]
MPDFKTHISIGLYTYPIYIATFIGITEAFNIDFNINPSFIGIGYMLYILGSDIPDIDSHTSLIKRSSEVILAAIISAIFYISIAYPYFQNYLIGFSSSKAIGIGTSFAISVLVGLGVSKTIDLLSHRGFMHTLLAAIGFAVLINLIYLASEGFQITNQVIITNSLYISLSGFLGYLLHLIADKIRV